MPLEAKCHNNEGQDEGCGNSVSYLDRCVIGGGEAKTGCPLHGRCGEWRGLVNMLQSKTKYIYSLFDFFFNLIY